MCSSAAVPLSEIQNNDPAENGGGDRKPIGDDVELAGMGGGVSIRSRVGTCCRNTFTVDNVLAKFPAVKWLPKYRPATLQSDIIAGLTVGLTVIPQGLAYATIANLPPQYGLYSAFMGCFVYVLMGTSKDITLGPTALMSLMTATFATLPGNDPTLAVVLTLVCGVLQLTLGILQLGILVNYISYPVINAFTSAAAITIGIGQLKYILGLHGIRREFLHMIEDLVDKIPESNWPDIVMGVTALIFVELLKKLRTIKWSGEDDPDNRPSFPVKAFRKFVWLAGTGANAIIVIVAAGTVAGMESGGIMVNETFMLTGKIEAGMPAFQAPSFEYQEVGSNSTVSGTEVFGKIGAGLIIVPLLGLVETMAIGKAFARQNDYKLDPTQELLAIGTANILSSFVQSYPITGSFSRTAVNSQSGVKTPLSGLFTGGLVILALCVLTPAFYYIPKAALAAVIISAVIKMVDYHIVLTLWRANKLDLIPLLITFIGSLVVGIEYGILMGIGINLLMLLYPIAKPKINYTLHRGFVVVQPMQGLNFPGSEQLEIDALDKALSGEKPRNICINMEHMSDLDYTAVQSLKTLNNGAGKHDVRLVLCNAQPKVGRLLKAAAIKDLLVRRSLKDVFDEFGGIQDDDNEEREPFVQTL